jgi:ribosome assembly protein RRB1
MKDKNHIVEELDDQDFSSEDMQTYIPEHTKEDLEVDEEAYLLLRYIDLDWPAQSITVEDQKIFLGTNPSQEIGQNSEPALVEIDIKNTDFENICYKKERMNHQINKIRHNSKCLYATSDTHLLMFSKDLKLIRQIKGQYGYALFVTEEMVFVGTSQGNVEIYSAELSLIKSFNVHCASIETICYSNNHIFTGSVDHTVKITDINGCLIEQITNDCDVNCLDVRNDRLVYGDDKGVVRIYNINTKETETISWHKSPISTLRWRDDDIFATGSDEQLCLWDITLEEEWDYHKYLLFVHQGEQLYKDVCFEDSMVIATSQDGICVFIPISFEEPEN